MQSPSRCCTAPTPARLTASAQLVAQGETVASASQAGTPTDYDLIRFGNFNGSIKRDGVSLGNVISAQITYANNLDRIETSAAGVEVVRDALAEAQGAVQPLIGHLDTLRWLFIALALGGIAVTIYARLDDWKRGRR